MQDTEGRGLCPPAEQIPKSIAPVISKASATNPLQLPGRSALPCSHGQGRVWPPNWPSMRRAGSQLWLRTQKHNANSSHPIGPSRGHTAFKSLLSWEGGEKQYFRAPEQAGGRKGFCASRHVLWERQHLRESSPPGVCSFLTAVTQTTDPMSPNWVSVGGQMCSVDAPKPPFF